jgi:hypothetical protein
MMATPRHRIQFLSKDFKSDEEARVNEGLNETNNGIVPERFGRSAEFKANNEAVLTWRSH